MSNNEHWNRDFGFTGPYTTFHNRHFQMVNLIKMHSKRTINRLNPHALPHEPEVNNMQVKEEKDSPSRG